MEAPCPTTSIGEHTGCESNILRLFTSKETIAKAEQFIQTNIEDVVENGVQGDHHCRFARTKDSFIDGEVREVLDIGVHYVQVSHGNSDGLDETYIEVEMTNSEGASICQESGFAAPPEAKLEKCFSKSATFPSSDLEFSHSFCVEEKVLSQSTTCQEASLDQLPTYKRSVSLPAPVKLVSAMKGGRAQHGKTFELDLNVKWASDVYDPPGSSMLSMIPTNDHSRPKLKKKDKHKHKHAKGKNVRGSNNEKKRASKRHVGGTS